MGKVKKTFSKKNSNIRITAHKKIAKYKATKKKDVRIVNLNYQGPLLCVQRYNIIWLFRNFPVIKILYSKKFIQRILWTHLVKFRRQEGQKSEQGWLNGGPVETTTFLWMNDILLAF